MAHGIPQVKLTASIVRDDWCGIPLWKVTIRYAGQRPRVEYEADHAAARAIVAAEYFASLNAPPEADDIPAPAPERRFGEGLVDGAGEVIKPAPAVRPEPEPEASEAAFVLDRATNVHGLSVRMEMALARVAPLGGRVVVRDAAGRERITARWRASRRPWVAGGRAFGTAARAIEAVSGAAGVMAV